MTSDNNMVFVYGTLKRGYNNHHHLEGASYCGAGRTVGEHFVMYDYGFPFVQAKQPGDLGTGRVMGELYLADAKQLASMDRLEGHPHFYRRERVSVYLGATKGSTVVHPWMYVGQGEVRHGVGQHSPHQGILRWDPHKLRHRYIGEEPEYASN